MKVLLISESTGLCENIIRISEKYDIDLINYRFPIKALDNIEEINPDSVIINAIDFPRHWKVIVQYIETMKRSDSKEPTIILLINNLFKSDDFNKAAQLNIKIFINIEADYTSEYNELESIFASNTKGEQNLMKSINFLFTHPISNKIITGTVNDIESDSISFLPEYAETVFNLQPGEILTNTILQIDDARFTPNCKITNKTGNTFKVSFEGITRVEKRLINNKLNHFKTGQSTTKAIIPATTR